jgi:FkbM family methyltransferase
MTETEYKAQWKQDKILDENIFKFKTNGFFVDVGAYDGITGSNTYFFEKNRKWQGLCIEGNSSVFSNLKSNRQSICLNVCAYKENKIVRFNKISGYSEMLSGISSSYCSRHRERVNTESAFYECEQSVEYCPSYRLETIFDNLNIKNVDLLSIDTEGSELDVLIGIDFDKVDISVIIIEENYSDISPICHILASLGLKFIHDYTTPIYNFLTQNNYKLIAKIGGDCIYKKNEKNEEIEKKQEEKEEKK